MQNPRALKTFNADAWPGALRPMIVRQADRGIKNSLQRVVSLLQLQATGGALTRPDEALTDAAARINAIAHWHAFLSQSQNGGRRTVALDIYLHAFVDHFIDIVPARSRIVLLVNADPLQVPAHAAGMIGQIASELVLNAVRHSFSPKQRGTIQVDCGTDVRGAIVLQVSDDGKEHTGPRAPRTFSMQIVAALAKQLGGRCAATRTGAQVRYRVTIPMPGRASSTSRKPRSVHGKRKRRRRPGTD